MKTSRFRRPERRRIVVEGIRKDGYDVRESSDGSRLLVNLTERYTRRREDVTGNDLIISDTRMPIWTALDILAGLRQKQWTVPVILMTAFGDDETRRRAEVLGAILFDKPFAIDALRTAVTILVPFHQREGASEPRDLEPLDPAIT